MLEEIRVYFILYIKKVCCGVNMGKNKTTFGMLKKSSLDKYGGIKGTKKEFMEKVGISSVSTLICLK